jgi:hypothetical protein
MAIGGTLFLAAPILPWFTERLAKGMTLAELESGLTVTIQALSLILLLQRILRKKTKKDERSSEQ